MKYNTSSVQANPDKAKACQTSAETSLDPGDTIRRIGLSVFALLLLIGIPVLIYGYNAIENAWWGMIVTKKAAVRIGIGTLLISTAGSMLLPLLSFAAWRTSKWRCELAKKNKTIDTLLSVPLEGSLYEWTRYWVVLSWVGGLFAGAILLLFCVNLDYNRSIIVVSDQTAIHASSIVSSVVSAFIFAEFFCILWVFCLKDHLREVEDIKRLLRARSPKNNTDWTEQQIKQTEKQIKQIISDMVPLPGKSITMGKFEVTQEQWLAVMGSNPASFKGEGLPVETVSWDDCQKFCAKLNNNTFVKDAGISFRLPTKEEWEYACRAGSTGDFCRLADETEITSETLGKVAWFGENSNQRTHIVGNKEPNAFGLYDVHGNVWEWTSTADGEHRIRRGGCWASTVSCCKSTYPSSGIPSDGSRGCGFRLCAETATK